jgi:3-oxoadipate enol-lactonase
MTPFTEVDSSAIAVHRTKLDRQSIVTKITSRYRKMSMGQRTSDRILSRDIVVQDSRASTPTDDAARLTLNIRYRKASRFDASRPTIVLLPFWGGSASTFDAVLNEMAIVRPSGIYVALSYRGTGSSRTSEPDLAENHSVSALASDVLAVLQSKEFVDLIPSGKVLLSAHSMSAKVSLQLLHNLELEQPNRDTAKVAIAGLLLLAPAPPGPLEFSPEMREQSMSAYKSLESAKWTMGTVLTHRLLTDELATRLARDAISMSAGAKRGWLEIGMRTDCTSIAREVAKSRPGMRVNVLVAWEDKVETPEKVRKETVDVLEAMGFRVETKVINGCGHLIPIEAVGEVVSQLSELVDG